MIGVAGTIPTRPDTWEEAKALAAHMVEETLKEPGCNSYQFNTATSQANTCFFSASGNPKKHSLHILRCRISKIFWKRHPNF